jgi:hypothetical protein
VDHPSDEPLGQGDVEVGQPGPYSPTFGSAREVGNSCSTDLLSRRKLASETVGMNEPVGCGRVNDETARDGRAVKNTNHLEERFVSGGIRLLTMGRKPYCYPPVRCAHLE